MEVKARVWKRQQLSGTGGLRVCDSDTVRFAKQALVQDRDLCEAEAEERIMERQ